MTGWIVGAIVAAFVVAGLLLSESGGSTSYHRRGAGDRLMAVFGVLLAVVLIAMVWGGGIAEFVGCVCIVLKLLAVEPVASWTWLEVFLPLIGGVVVQYVGTIVAAAVSK
jgi:hypothetical protein